MDFKALGLLRPRRISYDVSPLLAVMFSGTTPRRSLDARGWPWAIDSDRLLLRHRHLFQSASKIQPFDYGGRFRKYELNPYLEYGLTPRVTAVLTSAFLTWSTPTISMRSAAWASETSRQGCVGDSIPRNQPPFFRDR